MDIVQGKNFKYENTCVTIGKFDGIHIGHRRILDKVLELCGKYGYKSTVFTFDLDYFNTSEKRLNTREEKRALLKECGIDLLIDYPFDDTTKNQSPEEFARDVLQGKLGAKALVVGDNFRFGKGAKGDTDTLKVLGEKYGFKVYVIPMVEYAGDVVSSSRIREDIKAGNLIDANKMLNGETSYEKSSINL